MAKRVTLSPLLCTFVCVLPLLPKQTPSPKGGRPPEANRAALMGIILFSKVVCLGICSLRRWVVAVV